MNTNLNPSDISFTKSDFIIAKIVSNPSETSWSQAYNAGNLFAVLSLQKEPQEETESAEAESLSAIGKKILDSLEQNFFTIEDKNLETIKQAVLESSKFIPQNIESSFVVAAFSKNVLYLFANDKGKVFIKRNDKFGVILESNEIDSKSTVSSSGIVKNSDFIVLGTKNFFNIIDSQMLVSSFDHKVPSEIAEILTPVIHQKEESKAAAIIICYEEKEESNISPVEKTLEEEPQKEPKTETQRYDFFNKLISALKEKIKMPNFKQKAVLNLNHSRKIYLTIAVTLFIVLTASVFFSIKKQNDAKTKTLFDDIYTRAQKSYDEGTSLLDLNKNLARDNFNAAQKILNYNKDKFPAKSKEAIQTQDLLKKVDSGLTQVSPIDKSGLDRSKLSITVENGSGTEGVAGKAANILKEIGYNTPSTGNADNYNYKGVTIKVKNSKSNFLDLLKKDLSKDYTITTSSSDLSSSFTTDALVIIGK